MAVLMMWRHASTDNDGLPGMMLVVLVMLLLMVVMMVMVMLATLAGRSTAGTAGRRRFHLQHLLAVTGQQQIGRCTASRRCPSLVNQLFRVGCTFL